MKRPTANVSGDNPGIQPLWPVRSVTRRSFTSALLPLTYFPRTGSSNTVTWATHLFWQLPTSFTWPGEQGHYIPREYPFAVA
jgi:hypothetical protein